MSCFTYFHLKFTCFHRLFPIGLFTFVGAGAVGKIGYYQPFILIGSALSTIGGGFIYTYVFPKLLLPLLAFSLEVRYRSIPFKYPRKKFQTTHWTVDPSNTNSKPTHSFDINTGPPKFIGYQVIAGIGVGLCIQVPIVVAQATSSRADASIAMATVMFFQFVGSAIGVASGQNILDELLLKNLPKYAPSVSPQSVLGVGAYDLAGSFPDDGELLGVKRSYIVGLRGAWAFAVALTGVAFVVGFGGVWRSFKSKLVVPVMSEGEKVTGGEEAG